MGKMLNFSESEKKDVKIFLGRFSRKPVKTKYEEMRVLINGCTVTLYSTGKMVVQGDSAEDVKERILREVKTAEGGALVLGIDETGRGESYGPFVVAGVLGKNDDFRELRDSKKTRNLAEKHGIVVRKALWKKVIQVSAGEIDRERGEGRNMNEIEAEIINQIAELCLKKQPKAIIQVDGAPLKGVRKGVEFIVKGDDKVPVIGAASVLAKWERENSGDTGERKSWKGKTAGLK